MNRIYHPYHLWEETYSPMWRKAENREEMLKDAIKFTGDPNLYGRAMLRVIKEWKHSCEHNLTNTEQNRKAWLGHAACAYALGFPEDVVREAWLC